MEGLNANPGEITDFTTTIEDIAIGDNFLTFVDDNSSVVFKGVIDPSGTFLIDPSFVNILLDRSQAHPQSYVETANGMTLQMIQMPPTFSLGGKADKLVYTEDLREKQNFQGQADSQPFPTCDLLASTNLQTTRDVDTTNNLPLLYFSQSPPAGSTEITMPGTHRHNQDIQTIPINSSVEPAEVIQPPTGRGPFQCSICLKSFQGYQQFRKHKTSHLDDKPYRCKDCGAEFNFEMNLKLHAMVHEAEKSGNLQCQVCQAKFSRLASLKSHLRVHEKEENLVCNECGEEVPTVAKLNDHMEEHRTRVQQCMVYRCKLCGKAFNSQALLRDHSKGHAAVRKELKVFARQKPRSKPKQKTNAESSSWIPAKDMKKKRVCSVCSKAFDKPSQLVRHFRVHSGEKPFQCSYVDCNKRFNQKVTLESHVLACHQGLKPFKCHLCNICFSQRGNLKSHIVKVHIPSGENERVFKCHECACVYRRLATLNHHISRVHAVISTDLPQHSGKTSLSPEETIIQDEAAPSETVVILAPPSPNDPPADGFNPVEELQEQPPLVTVADVTSKVDVGPAETTIQEVNCVYGDSHLTPRRCLLKVKKVGQLKFHLCPACPKSFRKPSDLIRHIRVHTLERPYLCTVCAKSFAVKSTLNTHMKTHDPVKRLSCSVCLKKFSVLSSLKSHERLHTGAKPFQCMQCGKQFRTSTQRRVHQKTHTRNALGLTGRRKLLRIGEIKSTFKLPDPLKITSDGLVPVPNRTPKTTLDGVSVDQRSRPYRCTHMDCTATFKKSSHLKQHHLSHTGERPYKCLQCHRNFISSGVLKNHIKTHEGVRAYSCKECHFAFTTNGSLKRHMATHMHERLFVCPYCARTFKTSVATRKHIKVHRNEIVPHHSSYAALENPKSGIMAVDQSIHTNEPQQFHEVQSIDPSAMTSLYQNGYSDMSHLLGNNLNMPMTTTDGCCLATETENQLAPTSSSADDQLDEAVAIHCQSKESTLLLEYELPDSDIIPQDDPSENLELPLDQDNNFDSAMFALQQGESLDLQFLQDSQGIGNDSQNCLATYDFQSQSILVTDESVQQSQPTLVETMECVQEVPLNQNNPGAFATANSSSKKQPPKKTEARRLKTKESMEVRKLREVSRPISEQLYTELATQPYQRRPKERHSPPPLRLDEGTEMERAGNKDCPICHTKFKKKSDMDRHLRIHTGEKPYRCGVCGKSFRVKSTRQAHMRTHEEKRKTVSCHVCQNLFSTKSSLRVHLRLHLDLKPYQCPFPNCTRSFRTSGHRKSHVQSHFKQTNQFGVMTGNLNDPMEPSTGTPGQESDFDAHERVAHRVLPPVQTIKDNPADLQQGQDLPGVHTIIETENPATQNNTIHVLGGVQLQLDGLQFASLDFTQVDESFLQSVTNVIFLPASTSEGATAQLIDGSNMVIGMLPTQELNSATDILSGKDILSSLNLLGSSAEQLTTTGQVTLSDNNIHQYIINNNEMMSSTARPSSSIPSDQSQTFILSSSHDLICSTCQLSFSTKQQLQKHVRTHLPLPLPKPFKCSICFRSFTQNASLQAHLKAHRKEKKDFQCNLCPYTTERKPNLKTHFTRAHPDNWAQFNQVINDRKESVSDATGTKVVVSSSSS